MWVPKHIDDNRHCLKEENVWATWEWVGKIVLRRISIKLIVYVLLNLSESCFKLPYSV